MAPRKKKEVKTSQKPNINAYIAGAGLTACQPITETIETNFMTYAMSVIVSRPTENFFILCIIWGF